MLIIRISIISFIIFTSHYLYGAEQSVSNQSYHSNIHLIKKDLVPYLKTLDNMFKDMNVNLNNLPFNEYWNKFIADPTFPFLMKNIDQWHNTRKTNISEEIFEYTNDELVSMIKIITFFDMQALLPFILHELFLRIERLYDNEKTEDLNKLLNTIPSEINAQFKSFLLHYKPDLFFKKSKLIQIKRLRHLCSIIFTQNKYVIESRYHIVDIKNTENNLIKSFHIRDANVDHIWHIATHNNILIYSKKENHTIKEVKVLCLLTGEITNQISFPKKLVNFHIDTNYLILLFKEKIDIYRLTDLSTLFKSVPCKEKPTMVNISAQGNLLFIEYKSGALELLDQELNKTWSAYKRISPHLNKKTYPQRFWNLIQPIMKENEDDFYFCLCINPYCCIEEIHAHAFDRSGNFLGMLLYGFLGIKKSKNILINTPQENELFMLLKKKRAFKPFYN